MLLLLFLTFLWVNSLDYACAESFEYVYTENKAQPNERSFCFRLEENKFYNFTEARKHCNWWPGDSLFYAYSVSLGILFNDDEEEFFKLIIKDNSPYLSGLWDYPSIFFFDDGGYDSTFTLSETIGVFPDAWVDNHTECSSWNFDRWQYTLNSAEQNVYWICEHQSQTVDNFFCTYEIPYCDGIVSSDPTVCNGNGYCFEEEECFCFLPIGKMAYDSNNYCEAIHICNGVMSNDSRICSGSGDCNEDGKCDCYQYIDDDPPEENYGDNCAEKFSDRAFYFSPPVPASGQSPYLGPAFILDYFTVGLHNDYDDSDPTAFDLCSQFNIIDETILPFGEVVTDEFPSCEFLGDFDEAGNYNTYGIIVHLNPNTYAQFARPLKDREISHNRGQKERYIVEFKLFDSVDGEKVDIFFDMSDYNPGARPLGLGDILIISGIGIGGVCVVLCILAFLVIGIVVLCVSCRVAAKRKREEVKKEVLNSIETEKGEYDLKDMDELDAKEQAKFNINKDLFKIDMKEVKVKKSIGKGGFAIVYLARWNNIDVAFKSFDTRMLADTQNDFDMFEKELNLFSSLRHPNIPSFYGATLAPPRCGIIMEYCSDGDLTNYLTEKTISIPERFRILKETANGMTYLHSKKIIHRDLKPENILINKGVPKITDFGVSRFAENRDQTKTQNVGTSLYMAPEVCTGEKYDNSCDVFAFGLITWCTLTCEFNPYGKTMNSFNIQMKVASNPNFRPNIETIDGDVRKKYPWVIEMMKNAWDGETSVRPSFKEIFEKFDEMEKSGGAK